MTEPIRILQLITELRPGGAERIVYELARGLPRERYAVAVCSLRPATGAVADWLRAAGVPVHSLEMTGKLDVRGLGRLTRRLRDDRVTILHTHLFHANLLGRLAARRAGTPVVLGTIHIAERRFRPWHFWLDRLTLGPRGLEVCVSEAVRAFTRQRARIPAERLRVIPNGVDLSRFAPARDPAFRAQAAAELRRACGLAPETRVAVSVGRLEPQKDHLTLLAAWARVGREGPPEAAGAALLIAGEGAARPQLERRIAALGLASRVRLLGHRDDIPALLAGADALAFSSIYEGFGLALVEAMAAGLPIVATNVDSVPEVLGDSGAGVLAPARDPEALAAALTRVLALPAAERERMGQAGRVRAREFSLERMLGRYEALYGERRGGN